MAKHEFTIHFQKNLCIELQKLITIEWGFNHITVETETSKKHLEGLFNGFIDIAILNSNNSKSIVAIEIEHISEYNQAYRNIVKLKQWSHKSHLRKCSLLHLFNENCNIKENQMETLINIGKEHERQGLGFYYDFAFYTVDNKNKTLLIPKALVSSKEFKVRLWKLISDSELLVE